MIDKAHIKRYNLNEFISFADLLLRWKKDPHIILPIHIYERELHVYWAVDIFIYEQENRKVHELNVKDITTDMMSSPLYFINNAWRLLFKIDEVLELENKYGYYPNLSLNMPSKSSLEASNADEYYTERICNIQNIEQLAAWAVFLICKYNYPTVHELISDDTKPKKINRFQMLEALRSKEETSECPKGAVKDWKIELDTLFKLEHEIIEKGRKENNPKLISEASIEDIAEKIDYYKHKFFYEEVELMKTIMILYPDLLRIRLGKVFAYDPTIEISIESQEERGKKSRLKVFTKYPYLKDFFNKKK